VPATAIALALGAAVLHAVWNVLLARSEDPRGATAVAVVVGWVAIVPVAALTWRVDARAWPFIVASGVAETIYVILLATAYRRAELSVVYPIARGVAPVIVLLVSVAVLGEPSTLGEALGVVSVGAGVLIVRGVRRVSAPGVGAGLAIAATIATYTLIDAQGVQHAAPVPYLAASMALPAIAYPVLVGRTQGLGALRSAVGATSAIVGLLIFGAYGLVLAALTLAPPAPVAAVRETSVVIATGLAALVLHEHVTRRRAIGAALVVLGVELVIR
jgi:drug/metabolite transporter (DMT)-like permease